MANKSAKEKYSITGCIGCGICINSNPKVFKFGKDGLAKIEMKNTNRESVERVSHECPVGAIKINK